MLVIDADMIMREPFTPEVGSMACQCTAAAVAAAAGTTAGHWELHMGVPVLPLLPHGACMCPQHTARHFAPQAIPAPCLLAGGRGTAGTGCLCLLWLHEG